MRIDRELQQMLVEKAQYYQETVPVFRIVPQNATDLHKDSLQLASRFSGNASANELRYSVAQGEDHTKILLAEGASLRYYHSSGNKIFDRNTNPFNHIINDNAQGFEKNKFEDTACDLLEKNQLNFAASLENLQFEKLWLLKASGINHKKEQGRAMINRLVYSYRRFLVGLPVWGRASVFIKVAAENVVDAFGIDWRKVHDAPLDKASTLAPDDGARRVLEELQNTNPEKTYTTKDFTPDFFALGYFSATKRSYQSVMQPVWVARFISNGFSRMGHVIAVPAANTAYEPICRKVTSPPFNEQRPQPRLIKDECNKATAPGYRKC